MKIVFFNHYHNGDIHVSRGFIRKIIEKFPNNTFYYSHKNSPQLLSDIENLIFDNFLIHNVNEHDGIIKINDCFYINTWYGNQRFKYLNQYGITFDSIYASFNDSCKQLWNLSLEDISQNISDFYPIIDYSKFEIYNIKFWLSNNLCKKILVDNCKVLSNQSSNFPIISIIINLANKHKDKIFILTHKENMQMPNNIVYASDIINKNGSDLNEISFLSTYCNTIVGRASGPFTFTLTRDNLFVRNTKFVCFTNLVPQFYNKFWLNKLLQHKVNYSSNFTISNNYAIDNMTNLIEENI